MKLSQLFRGSLVALATVGVLFPQAGQVLAAEAQTVRQARISDVALQQGGVLTGQVVNADGVPQENVEVALESRGNRIAQVLTDSEGQFRIADIRGGAYEISAGEEVAVCRLWSAHTAPPSATPGVLLVTGGATRGQLGIVRQYGPGALIVLGGVAAVIAISASNDESGS